MSENKPYVGEERVIHTSQPFLCRTDPSISFTENELIINNNRTKLGRVLTILLCLVVSYFGLKEILRPADRDLYGADYIGLFFCGLVIFVCLIVIINVIINSERKFVFNRLEGTITMRSSVLNWRPGTVTIPFNEACIKYVGRLSHTMRIFLPDSIYKNLIITGTSGYEDDLRCISFFTWYMDKNRPLPPGEDLDPYREADYLRRKSEGFPPPLYPSKIETPDQDWYIPKAKNKTKNKKK